MAGRFRQAAWLLAEVDHRRDCWSAERHPLYENWAAGRLTAEELQTCAGELHHLVASMADVARRAAELTEGMLHEQLAGHAQERERDVERWCRFAAAAGWGMWASWHYAADPLPATEAAVRTWLGDGSRSLAEDLVTLYALETAQADVARRALDGLLGHYGIAGGPPTRYFELRLQGDAGPAGLLEAALTAQLPVGDPFALLRRAELAYRAHWDLVDGVARALTMSPDAPRERSSAHPRR